jgi:hypothetical protein
VPVAVVPRAAAAPVAAPAIVAAVPARVSAAAQPSAPLNIGCGEAGCSVQPAATAAASPDPDDDRRTLDAAVALLLIAPIYVLICAAVNRCVLTQHLQSAEAAPKDGADAATPLLPSSQAAGGRRLGYVCGGRVPLFVVCYVFEAVFFALVAAAVVSASIAAPGAAGPTAAAAAVAASPRASPPPPAPLSPPVPGVPAAVVTVVPAAIAPAPAVAAAGGPAGAPLAARSASARPSLGSAGSSDGGAGFSRSVALPSLRRAGPHGTPPPPAPWLDDHMFG